MKTPKQPKTPEAVTRQQVNYAQRRFAQLERYYTRQANQQAVTLRDLLSTANTAAQQSRDSQEQIIATEAQQQTAQLESQKQFNLAQLMQANLQAQQGRNQSILTQNERNLAFNSQDGAARRAAYNLSQLISTAQRNRPT